ncbi:hypothetical protein NDU88_005031 [Pleurodeles waltl]|uniref:Uncharacterized protein n=1 Tax=Pleurodeles waltl TaxID=8319 RepID=A0AAV7LK41_PLEWA|nr:hypothetical protein NDU88_005031 [Pleurodeles waltl]
MPSLHSRPPSALFPTLTVPVPLAPTSGASPILISDDLEPERRMTPIMTLTAPTRPRSLPESYYEQPGTGEEWEGSQDPIEYGLEQMDWYEGLGEAS